MEYAPSSHLAPQAKLGTASNVQPSSVLLGRSGMELSVPPPPLSTVLLAHTTMDRTVSPILPTVLLVLLGQVPLARRLLIVPTAHT